ncbi:MAG TPA: NAD(P)H-dependent glycerol-3-phosphate dehydrogenase [Bacilli bacterium]|nr:NAD(P)-dependent glycerol-3-phosphate dehydrogenase [Bacilli bacterium]HPY79563.1 NAD(P)H-dependent glycerol-3-phosphate dehydrogenase [Bacilli bacterium]HQA56033.1 NAD(P)H-dependent glycerol-3-phosphate dehydrogenase [Bacilli bacterium]
MEKVAILGAGTWGTALANLLARSGHEVALWSKFEEEINVLKSTHLHKNLPGSVISKAIAFFADMKEACEGKSIVVFATPSVYIRQTAEKAKPFLKSNQIIVNVAKGIEPKSLLTMSEILEDVLGKDFNYVSLSGPTHAEEVAIGLPTLIVSACQNPKIAQIIQDTFSNQTMRVYTNPDVRGVELSGALKNIIALAGGMSDGLGYGDNAKAAIITRGLVEITELGRAMGCHEKTFFGLAGIGDIVVTATSIHSRNHKAGYLLGQGRSLEDVLKEVGQVVEGLYALEAAKELEVKYNVELPIIDVVYEVVHDHLPVSKAIQKLFSRKKKDEINDPIFTEDDAMKEN